MLKLDILYFPTTAWERPLLVLTRTLCFFWGSPTSFYGRNGHDPPLRTARFVHHLSRLLCLPGSLGAGIALRSITSNVSRSWPPPSSKQRSPRPSNQHGLGTADRFQGRYMVVAPIGTDGEIHLKLQRDSSRRNLLSWHTQPTPGKVVDVQDNHSSSRDPHAIETPRRDNYDSGPRKGNTCLPVRLGMV